MDLMSIAADVFRKQLGAAGDGLDTGSVQAALRDLMGDGQGQLDLAGIVGRLQGGGLASLAASWLGDGGNDAISPQKILDLFGQSAVGGFASQLGLGEKTAAEGLAGMLTELIDKHSQGGSLLEAVAGGSDGLLGAASKLLR